MGGKGGGATSLFVVSVDISNARNFITRQYFVSLSRAARWPSSNYQSYGGKSSYVASIQIVSVCEKNHSLEQLLKTPDL